MRGKRFGLALLLALELIAPAGALASGPPEIPATWVTGVTPTSATLRAEINPEGASTTYRFQYLSAAEFVANVQAGHDGFLGARAVPAAAANAGSGSAPQKVFFSLLAPSNPLAPATAYRYRVVATNAAGTTEGSVRTLRTEVAGAPAGLPDARAWEMVSPPDKGGGAVAGPGALFGGGEIQAAAAGGALTFSSATAFGGSLGAPPAPQYVSRRAAGSWSTESVTAPLDSASYGDRPDGVPYRLFSPDLARGLMLNASRCQAEACPRSYSLRELPAGPVLQSPEAPALDFAGAAPDLRHAVFASEGNLYEWGGGGLSAVNVLPGETTPTAGAILAARAGAISKDGSRVYFSELKDGAIYLREGGQTKLLPETAGGGASFQVASADGSVALFTAGGTLYRYDAAEASEPIAAGVIGVLGASRDASRVYYQDGAGLWLWQQGGPTLALAPGADAAAPSDYPPASGTARVSADGSQLAFLSAAPIGEYDNTDAESGEPDTELYLYDANQAPQLSCVSCSPTGERPQGSASIPGAEVNGATSVYKPRVLSADGRRLFFESADALVKGDTNSRPDVYQWEREGEGDCRLSPGCLGLISAGRGEGGSFLDASADGADAFFLTVDSLVSADPGSIDVYDARIGGGFPEPGGPIACVGDACQALPSPPEDPTPGTLFKNSGNPALKYFSQDHRSCKKGFARRHGKCVRKAHHRPGHDAKRAHGGRR